MRFKSELEIARGFLQGCQIDLHAARGHRVFISRRPGYDFIAQDQAMIRVRNAQYAVLAALSWVWDAQQREIMQEGFDVLGEIVVAMRSGAKPTLHVVR